MQENDRYVVVGSDHIYKISSNCSDGASVNLQSQTVTNYYLINGNWLAGSVTQIGNYSSSNYICNVWSSKNELNINFVLLPAVILVALFFSVIFKWFARLRG